MNIQPKPEVYEKNVECTLPKEVLIQILLLRYVACKILLTQTYEKLLTSAKIFT